MASQINGNLSSTSDNCKSPINNSSSDENVPNSKSSDTNTVLTSSHYGSNYPAIQSQIPFYIKSLIKDGNIKEIKEIHNYKPSDNTNQYIHKIDFTVKNENLIKSFEKIFYIFKKKINSSILKKNQQNDNSIVNTSETNINPNNKKDNLKNKIGVLVLTKNDNEILVREYFLITLDRVISVNDLGKHINIKYSQIPSEITPEIYSSQDSSFHILKLTKINRNKIFELSEKIHYICFDYANEILNSQISMGSFYKSQNIQK